VTKCLLFAFIFPPLGRGDLGLCVRGWGLGGTMRQKMIGKNFWFIVSGLSIAQDRISESDLATL